MIDRAISILAEVGAVVEVRAIADGAIHSGYFDDHTALVRSVEALDADPSVYGIYVTLNTVNPALLARRANRIKMRLSRKDATTSDADILRRRWLPIDIDPKRPAGVSSTDGEHLSALDAAERVAAYLSEQGFPEPLRADSGNGAHLLYRIDLPNDEPSATLVKAVLSTLDALFSNDAVSVDTANHNAARIWKLYGTVSRKGDSTPERPHRRSRLISAPEEMAVVPPLRLGAVAGVIPREEAMPRRQKTAGFDLGAWLSGHGIAVRAEKPWQGGRLFVLEECPFSSAHRDGAFAIQFSSGAVFAGCHHQSCGGGAQRWPDLRRLYEKAAPPPEAGYRARALEILRHGDPMGFILDTFNRGHVGDRTVAEALAVSVVSRSVANTNGLHVAISGNSGKGKSHACRTMLNLVPEGSKMRGTVSDRALYYDEGLLPGTVLLFDDVALSDDLQEILRSATANFREPIEHRTLTAERRFKVCTIPQRCVWWLAKVEDPGDDQVMNRMLTVWIDDSAAQDRRVLEHMKTVEAGRCPPAEDDPAVLTCRAVWEVLGEEVLGVRIPFAQRVSFSSAANRRNPGMLFDLIKCYARLFFMQRGRDEDGAVVATEADFTAAARLYEALGGAAGGQETKLTRNEAAALETVDRMGVSVFTVRSLQEAMGLPYQKTRRILHGYTSRGTVYAGLLAKCPAVSLYDASVSETMPDGETVRRREQHFTFDPEVYRAWSHGAAVWLDDSNDSSFEQPDSTGCQREIRGSDSGFADGARSDGISSPDGASFQQIEIRTAPPEGGGGSGEKGVCAPGNAVTQEERDASHEDNEKGDKDPGLFTDSSCCKPAEDCSNLAGFAEAADGMGGGFYASHEGYGRAAGGIDPADYIALPVSKDEPCHVCGGRPTSSVRRDSDEYLCYACFSRARRARAPAKPRVVQPLPGVLDHRGFERVKAEIGRCDLCGAAKAVYRSPEARTNLCEGCYARLVRDWNREAGVR
ncbi:hypothetical protein [Methanoculleus receptaculi]|uniref:Uncharacterized protein n=1 Tax=Methanoculleus receptaculi TaxID=394967 RepID=A0AAX4FTJ1_9EURY|nr:hypothetical protein [Methanoculleus receptaculi]WOX56778.1 hypothetical protein R6Y96_05480 [Methanoculleus receptaculi]